MHFYREITLIDQAEISPYVIWSKLHAQLHLALVEQKDANGNVNIGMSFPQYVCQPKQDGEKAKASLGKKLRLFAPTEADLQRLDLDKWLERLHDYVHITAIRPVPKQIQGYALYKRKNVKSNPEKLARAEAKKNRHSYDSALAHYQKFVQHSHLPYIQTISHSTKDAQTGHKHGFKLFIEKLPGQASDSQVFNTYGLGSESTVPEF